MLRAKATPYVRYAKVVVCDLSQESASVVSSWGNQCQSKTEEEPWAGVTVLY